MYQKFLTTRRVSDIESSSNKNWKTNISKQRKMTLELSSSEEDGYTVAHQKIKMEKALRKVVNGD